MKTISLADFEVLAARTDWVATQELEVIDKTMRHEEGEPNPDGSYEQVEVYGEWGSAYKTSRLNGIEIIYNTLFSYDLYNLDSLSVSANPSDTWEVKGVTVLDESGCEIQAHDLADYLPNNSQFDNIDYSELKIEQTKDIDIDDADMDENSNMQTVTLEIDGEPNIRFTGELLVEHTSQTVYNDNGRWTELKLFKTASGKFICYQVGCTKWINEKTRKSCKVCASHAEVIEYFGQGWLAKELYDAAEIENITDID